MIYDTDSEIYQSFTMVKCNVCWDHKKRRELMPDKTSCKCKNNICCKCFFRDFHERKRCYAIRPDPENVASGCVDKCDSPALEDVLAFTQGHFQDDERVTFYSGRNCPFCNILQLWNMEKTPRVLPSTGRLTFFESDYNWNITEETGVIDEAA